MLQTLDFYDGQAAVAKEFGNEFAVRDTERQQMLKDAGFTAALTQELASSPHDKVQTLYPELRGKELKDWKRFLPVVLEPSDYRGPISDDALSAVYRAKGLRQFKRIEIWTPGANGFLGRIARKREKALADLNAPRRFVCPMAVGVAIDSFGKEHYHRIAMWGRKLRNLKQVRRYVRGLNLAAFVGKALPYILGAIGASLYVMAFLAFGVGPVLGCTLILGFLGFFGFMIYMIITV